MCFGSTSLGILESILLRDDGRTVFDRERYSDQKVEFVFSINLSFQTSVILQSFC